MVHMSSFVEKGGMNGDVKGDVKGDVVIALRYVCVCFQIMSAQSVDTVQNMR